MEKGRCTTTNRVGRMLHAVCCMLHGKRHAGTVMTFRDSRLGQFVFRVIKTASTFSAEGNKLTNMKHGANFITPFESYITVVRYYLKFRFCFCSKLFRRVFSKVQLQPHPLVELHKFVRWPTHLVRRKLSVFAGTSSNETIPRTYRRPS